MLSIAGRIQSFAALGGWLRAGLKDLAEEKKHELAKVVEKAGAENPWFTKTSVLQSLEAIAGWLDAEVLEAWSHRYFLSEPGQVKQVAVIMAGNIPLVNFHDFLAVLITGHRFLGKLSSQDKVLLPFLAAKLMETEPGWKEQIRFTEEKLDAFDAVIATGSNNTSRYFEYYFGKYPHIIRKNRHSMAILTGDETALELNGLYDDVFQYYGMGCRNVSMLLVPAGYNFPALFDAWKNLPPPTEHNKYKNNYDYYRSLYLVNQQPFYDTGYVSVIRDEAMASPVSVVHYKEYADSQDIKAYIETHQEGIQCIVSKKTVDGWSTVLPGTAQCPAITDYPDGVDMVQFLLAL